MLIFGGLSGFLFGKNGTKKTTTTTTKKKKYFFSSTQEPMVWTSRSHLLHAGSCRAIVILQGMFPRFLGTTRTMGTT